MKASLGQTRELSAGFNFLGPFKSIYGCCEVAEVTNKKILEAESRRHQKIAKNVACEVSIVAQAFTSLGPSLVFLSKSSHQLRADAYNQLAELSAKVEEARRALEAMREDIGLGLDAAGGVTVPQLENFEELILSQQDQLRNWNKLYNRRGDKKWDARQVAILMALLFEDLEYPIKVGHTNGEPNTNFAKAVQFALHVFKIDADWKGPALGAKKFAQIRKTQNLF